ncbi:unnamed protein product, partial [Iphiclides podalirius]
MVPSSQSLEARCLDSIDSRHCRFRLAPGARSAGPGAVMDDWKRGACPPLRFALQESSRKFLKALQQLI